MEKPELNRGTNVFQVTKLINALVLLVVFALAPVCAPAAQTPAAEAGPMLYRMDQLEAAKKRAAQEHKPIAWIASRPEFLTPYPKLLGHGSHAATAYAVRALRNDTVLVFSDALTENHHEPKIVDQALHSPNPHYTVPGVVILTPSLDRVICKAPFTTDPHERIRIYTEVLRKIREKFWNKP
jgi:hypothetical protein